MYLSALELFGFKSFPKRTRLLFKPGVVAIIGPNGCGKTNIVDAVRWVLGEQRSAMLRSDKMENMIFAGANGRKPMHMAEVTLVIGDPEGVLNVETPELAVTRRLNRNGESQYLINKRPVRLKDIRSLFADTGLGPDSYSIIELSMVEGILSGRPEERRRLFEEAAGVTLYKSRLKAARHKLVATDADLLRLEDLIGEVESQRRSLQRQVRKAQRYRYLAEALRVREISAAKNEIAELRARLAPLEERIEKDKAAREGLEKRRAKAEAELADARGKLGGLEEQISNLTGEKADTNTRLQAVRREIVKLEERIRGAERRVEEREKERSELTERRKEIARKIEETNRLRVEAEKQAEEIAARLEGMKDAVRKSGERLDDFRRRKEEREKEYHDEENALTRISAEKKRLEERKDTLEKRLAELEEEQSADGKGLDPAPLADNLAKLEREQAALEEEWEKSRGQLEVAREMRAGSQRAEAKAASELDAAQRRTEFLKKMVLGGEGRPQAVKNLLGSGIEGLLGRLGDSVVVAEEWRPAVAAALEVNVSAVVARGRETAARAAEVLLAGERGRGMLAILEDSESDAAPKPEFAGGEGVLGPLIDQVRTKGPAGKAARKLLARVWVVRDLETMLRLGHSAASGGWILVTPDGCRLTPDGILTAGTVALEDLGAVGLLEEAEKEKDECLNRLNEARVETERRIEAERRCEEKLTALEKSKRAGSEELEKEKQDYARVLAEERERMLMERHRTAERERINSELDTILPRMEEIGAEIEKQRELVDTIEDDLADMRAALAGMEEEQQALSRAWEKLRDRQVEAGTRRERLQGEIRRLGTLMEEFGHRIEQLSQQSDENRDAREDAEERLRRIRAEAALLERDADEIEKRLEKVRAAYELQRTKSASMSGSLDALRADISRNTDRLHTGELEIADLRHRFTSVRETILENYQVDLLTASQEELPLAVDEENPYLEKPLSELRENLRDMGPVNQMALEEFEIIDRRYKSQVEQRDDLLAAKETLEQTIGEINSIARKRFLETFAKVESHFIRLFARLFGGGVAGLSMGEGDPLEAGIHITASPRSKRLASIDLLSGGEKALTAIALLFALYLERPAPFCFLDEVDAPLDEVNVIRFNKLLREFTDQTQFLIVTHNKLTMERSDRLYGVTMEEEGVSSLVTVELPAERKGEPNEKEST